MIHHVNGLVVDIAKLSLTFQADGKRLLFTLVRFASNYSFVGDKRISLDKDAIGGNYIATLQINDVANMQIVFMFPFFEGSAVGLLSQD